MKLFLLAKEKKNEEGFVRHQTPNGTGVEIFLEKEKSYFLMHKLISIVFIPIFS